ncbi:MAG: hypothetical protein MSG64_11820 [Pyrinomonadaceae bacterium MAG19_C2-C3]|nr:hypothetical protein [Pyrinomonadaceae bacterium MAG19_C2-C3]
MHTSLHATNRWLAFESGVLRRLQFSSVAVARAGHTEGSLNLKRRGAQVFANDERLWAYTFSRATLDNTHETLSETEIDSLLTDVYAPGYRLRREELPLAFGELDAWWFDNLRERIEDLETPTKQSIALTLGIKTGEYARSFSDETRPLRQPLSHVFRRLSRKFAAPFDNRQRHTSTNLNTRDFIAGIHADLLLLRLPRFVGLNGFSHHHAQFDWRDAWLRSLSVDEAHHLRASMPVAPPSKTQYLNMTADLLERALHLPQWAIAATCDGFVSVDELVETIRRVRPVTTIYTKDFSEFAGARAAIIIAN